MCAILIGKHWVGFHGLVHLGANGGNYGVIGRRTEHGVYHLGNFAHEFLFGTACGDGRGAEADTGSLEW